MKSDDGFTLVEILASISIMMLLGTVFFQFFIFSQKATTENKEKLAAINIAQSELEKLKFGDYEEIQSPGYYGCSVCILDNEPGVTIMDLTIVQQVDGRNYSVLFIVSEEYEMGLYPVEVRVCLDNGEVESTVKGLVKL